VVVSVGGLRTLPVTPISTAPLILSSSIIEMQVIAATLLECFEFSLPAQTAETYITRKPLVLMVPMVEGLQYPWMGLKVRCVD
jgi:hypothetical protein